MLIRGGLGRLVMTHLVQQACPLQEWRREALHIILNVQCIHLRMAMAMLAV